MKEKYIKSFEKKTKIIHASFVMNGLSFDNPFESYLRETSIDNRFYISLWGINHVLKVHALVFIGF